MKLVKNKRRGYYKWYEITGTMEDGHPFTAVEGAFSEDSVVRHIKAANSRVEIKSIKRIGRKRVYRINQY